MIADRLAPGVWNAISEMAERFRQPREIYFCQVSKVDKIKKLIWVDDFGDLSIPLVAHNFSFMHFDTRPSGNVTSGQPVGTSYVKVGDKSQQNPAYHVEIITPKKGQIVAILDPWGAKRFPICIGVVHSKQGYWEGG